MKRIIGLLLVLMASGHIGAAIEDEAPPFSTFICKQGNVNVKVDVQNYRQTNGAGPAVISDNGSIYHGGWKWKAAEEGTRLTGYHYLSVSAPGKFKLSTLSLPLGELSGGWLETKGYSGPVDCKIVSKCQVRTAANCSSKPKRLCCECIDDQLSCY